LFFSLVSEDLRSALGRSFLVLIVVGAVTLFMGFVLSNSLNSSPPNIVSYWLGVLSWLINPLWAAMDILGGSQLNAQLLWTTKPIVVPGLVAGGNLWIFTTLSQIALAGGMLTLTALIYPRYRASRQGGVA
jgi:hypothetical protein